jgi:hypothetical protein
VRTSVTIERYHPGTGGLWDDVVRGARARHFMFERAYMDYHQDRFVDASWYVLLGDRPIGVMPASRQGHQIVSHGGLTFGGLISASDLTAVRAMSALRQIADALRADGARQLVYKPTPHIYHLEAAEEDLHALVAAGGRLVSRDVTAAVAPGMQPSVSTERRRALRKAAKAGLELQETASLAEFWALLGTVLSARHGVEPVHSVAEICLLADRFPGGIRLFTAVKDGEIVAGTLVFQTPTVAHAQYIAAGDRGRELFALDAVFDHLLRDVYPDVWFDFGISNERDGRLNEGLMRNKEGYGARALVHDRYVLDLR